MQVPGSDDDCFWSKLSSALFDDFRGMSNKWTSVNSH